MFRMSPWASQPFTATQVMTTSFEEQRAVETPRTIYLTVMVPCTLCPNGKISVLARPFAGLCGSILAPSAAPRCAFACATNPNLRRRNC